MAPVYRSRLATPIGGIIDRQERSYDNQPLTRDAEPRSKNRNVVTSTSPRAAHGDYRPGISNGKVGATVNGNIAVSRRRPGAHAAVLGTLQAAPVGVWADIRLPYRLGSQTRFPTPSNLIHSDGNRALRLPNVAQRRDTPLILPRSSKMLDNKRPVDPP